MPRSGPVPRRVRLAVLLAASALLFGSVMNLVLVAEPAPRVEPQVRDGATWQTGNTATDKEGSFSWSFLVDPRGDRNVELDLGVPFSSDVTHIFGSATLLLVLTVAAAGDEIATDRHTIDAEPRANQTERIQRRMTAIGDMGGDISPMRIDRDNDDPFPIEVTLDWRYTASSDGEVTYRTRVPSVTLEAQDAPGVPLCRDDTCARILLVAALAAQAVAVVWYHRAPPAPPRSDQAGPSRHP